MPHRIGYNVGMSAQTRNNEEYLAVLVNAIRVCAEYRPKLGHGAKEGYTLEEFQEIYRNDPFYAWIGLDNPLMYAAHKAAGGMTSIYRQIGIGCESLFRAVLKDALELTDEDVRWSYTVRKAGGAHRTLYLDGRIPVDKLADPGARSRVARWVAQGAHSLEVDPRVAASLQGVVFEVRQGYKSKDSKRQNADIANAATAYTRGYLPCAAILSLQIDDDIALRYRNEKWIVLTGNTADTSPHRSTYAFMQQIVGYDLAGFLQRNSPVLKSEVENVLRKLLSKE